MQRLIRRFGIILLLDPPRRAVQFSIAKTLLLLFASRDEFMGSSADETIGKNLRRLRLERSLGLEQLALLVNIDAKTLVAFETGTQRISAAAMYDLAIALDSPISGFFETVEPAPERNEPAMRAAVH
jgi:DNA-binding XRE family transcriptional regulator